MDDNKRRDNGLGALVTGMAIGAAVVMWLNEDSRAKIKTKIGEWADMGKDKVSQGKKKLAAGLDDARKKLEEENS